MTEEGIDRPEHARELAIQRLKLKQDFKGMVAGGGLAVLVCILVYLLGDDGYFWPVWVILGVGIAVVVQGWKAYGPSNRITEADVRQEMETG
jgi:hypothetical protein